ncbi:Tn3 family transposase, partial [Escherichia coli]|nr:Tn3 family transposase [Escherichia coli]
DRNRSHWSTSKTPSYTKSVSWQHHPGLALNIIVLWNTIYMDAAIQQLRREGYPVLDSDVEKLSPLQCGHINMQGRYSFIVPESVSKGELRAFNEDV